ncbi:hypothetical protein Pan3_52 [Pseudanabaena phage Pan3]|nr:hypothetical protein Pan3_52 [Pseudanabaena phage Pan3]
MTDALALIATVCGMITVPLLLLSYRKDNTDSAGAIEGGRLPQGDWVREMRRTFPRAPERDAEGRFINRRIWRAEQMRGGK